MIRLTRLNHNPLVLNADLIEHLEITPDTLIALTTGQKFMVLESADEVVERVIQFRGKICEVALAARFSAASSNSRGQDDTRPDPDDKG